MVMTRFFYFVVSLIFMLSVSQPAQSALFTIESAVVAKEMKDDHLFLTVNVCTPQLLYTASRQKYFLREAMRAKVFEVVKEESGTKPGYGFKVQRMALQSELEPDREKKSKLCENIVLDLKIFKSDDASITPAKLFGDAEVLRVGIRPGFRKIAYLDANSNTLQGPAIRFAKNLAAKLGRSVEFVHLSTPEGRFKAIEFGAADIVISLITHTKLREKRFFLSEPYFNTGLVLGSFAPDFPSTIYSGHLLNQPTYHSVASANSTGEKALATMFGKSRKHIAETTERIPEIVTKYGKKGYFVTDEVIAAQWRNAKIAKINGKTLLTEDEQYVVASWNESFIKAANGLISGGAIEKIYADSLRNEP